MHRDIIFPSTDSRTDDRSRRFGSSDTSGLTDADWAEINKLRSAYKSGGFNAVSKAMDQLLAKDAMACARVLGAPFPDVVREQIRDMMAESGIEEEDLRELIRELERSSRH